MLATNAKQPGVCGTELSLEIEAKAEMVVKTIITNKDEVKPRYVASEHEKFWSDLDPMFHAVRAVCSNPKPEVVKDSLAPLGKAPVIGYGWFDPAKFDPLTPEQEARIADPFTLFNEGDLRESDDGKILDLFLRCANRNVKRIGLTDIQARASALEYVCRYADMMLNGACYLSIADIGHAFKHALELTGRSTVGTAEIEALTNFVVAATDPDAILSDLRRVASMFSFRKEDFEEKPCMVRDDNSVEVLRYAHGILVDEDNEIGLRVFERGEALSRIAIFDDDQEGRGVKRKKGSVMIRQVERAFVQHVVATYGKFEKQPKQTRPPRACEPPAFIPDRILATAGIYQYPNLRGITECPIMRSDGSLFSSDGYDSATGIFMQTDIDTATLKDRPTRQDAQDALGRLKGLLVEFPFVEPRYLSVALAWLLTAVARQSVLFSPLFLASSPFYRTGKSLIIKIGGILATGRPPAFIAFTKNTEELRKRIDSVLLEGDNIVILDNVAGTLRSETLSQAISETLIKIRILGISDSRTVENTALFATTGVNMSVGEDLVARTLTMRIDANMEHPEFREFKFDPVKMVLEHRSEYVCDVFTILRAYIQAGKPKIEAMRPWVTFSDWSELIRAPLLWLGEDDPCDTCEEAAEDDPDTEQRAAIFEAWAVAFPGATPKTVAEILGFVGDNPHTPLAQALKNIPDLRARGGDFDDIASSGGGHGIDKDKFGLWLRSNRGRVIDNLKLDNKSKTAEKVKEGEKTKKAKKAKRAANWFVKEIH